MSPRLFNFHIYQNEVYTPQKNYESSYNTSMTMYNDEQPY